MSVTPSLLRFAAPAISNPALLALSASLSPKSAEAEESNVGNVKVVGRYCTRWFSPGENYCMTPSSVSRDEEIADFPVPIPPPISFELAQETEAEMNASKRQVVHRWRTESIPIDQPFCLTPLPTGRVILQDAWNLRDDAPPPPSLMPIPDEVSYDGPKSAFVEERGPPQATSPSLIPIYHRSRTEWIRPGDNFALTPGFNLEQFNAHVCEPKPATTSSWAQASAWALAQKSSDQPKKE